MADTAATDDRIPIAVVAGRAFVWTVENARRLREEHHICGLNSGTLPQVAQQNVFLGLPLQLLPEEVVLLVEQRLAYLVDDRKSHNPASELQVAENANKRSENMQQQQQEQAELSREKEAHVKGMYADKIAKRKEEKAQKRREQGLPDVHVPDFEEEASTPKDVQSISYTIHIEGDSNNLPWYKPEANAYYNLEDARKAGIWKYPQTKLQQAKCAVYKDLWQRGFFMGGGVKFGGDFLVYKGDPLRYHSHFSTTIYPTPLSEIGAIEFVACGRLATAVKKAHLLCGYDQDTGTVDYFSLEWSGMG